jgi:ABC-type antimicrobial peptide transport system permease subunit
LVKTVSSVLMIILFVTLFLSLLIAAPGLGIGVGFSLIPFLIQAITGRNRKMEIDDPDSATSVLHATGTAAANALRAVLILLAALCIAAFAMIVALFLICFGGAAIAGS